MRTYHDVEVAGGERPWDATRSVRLTAVDRRARHICMRRESCCACSPYCAVLATGRANRSIAGIAGLPLITPQRYGLAQSCRRSLFTRYRRAPTGQECSQHPLPDPIDRGRNRHNRSDRSGAARR